MLSCILRRATICRVEHVFTACQLRLKFSGHWLKQKPSFRPFQHGSRSKTAEPHGQQEETRSTHEPIVATTLQPQEQKTTSESANVDSLVKDTSIRSYLNPPDKDGTAEDLGKISQESLPAISVTNVNPGSNQSNEHDGVQTQTTTITKPNTVLALNGVSGSGSEQFIEQKGPPAQPCPKGRKSRVKAKRASKTGKTARRSKSKASKPKGRVSRNAKRNSAINTLQEIMGKSICKTQEADKGSVDADTCMPQPVVAPITPVPHLAYDLAKVLFNPGVYYLQDPRSRVYNFDPYLERIMPAAEFDFNALKRYITSSDDNTLRNIASDSDKRYSGSSSSMTAVLAHFHYLISQWRPLEFGTLSKSFPNASTNTTVIERAPAAIFLKWRNGRYAIDADKEFSNSNILMMLGKSMEKLLTLPTSEFEKYRLSNPEQVSHEARTTPDSFHFTTTGKFMLRSQLDAYDSRLPGTGMFDLKTRAVVTVRMDAKNYKEGRDYEIRQSYGEWESFEREYHDMIRSAFLKYSLQVRMGRMDGIFVAFHNTQRIFGFQYVPLSEMDQALHGQNDTSLGNREFALSLSLLEKVLDKATEKYPNTSLRLHFETRGTTPLTMGIFAEPVTDDQIANIQASNAAKVEAFERNLRLDGENKAAELLQENGGTETQLQADLGEISGNIELSNNKPSGEDSLSSTSGIAEISIPHKASNFAAPNADETLFSEAALPSNSMAAEPPEMKTLPTETFSIASFDTVDGGEDVAVPDVDSDRDLSGNMDQKLPNVVQESSPFHTEVQDIPDSVLENSPLSATGLTGEIDVSDDVLRMESEEVELMPKDSISLVGDGSFAVANQMALVTSDTYEMTDHTTTPANVANAHTLDGSRQDQPDARAKETSSGPIGNESDVGSERKQVFGMAMTTRNIVDGKAVVRPSNLGRAQKWEIEYALEEIKDERVEALYQACQKRRKKALADADGEEKVNYYTLRMRGLSKKGAEYRKERDMQDQRQGRERIVYSGVIHEPPPGAVSMKDTAENAFMRPTSFDAQRRRALQEAEELWKATQVDSSNALNAMELPSEAWASLSPKVSTEKPHVGSEGGLASEISTEESHVKAKDDKEAQTLEKPIEEFQDQVKDDATTSQASTFSIRRCERSKSQLGTGTKDGPWIRKVDSVPKNDPILRRVYTNVADGVTRLIERGQSDFAFNKTSRRRAMELHEKEKSISK